VTWRLATEVTGPGWFIVGDAAATLDPTSSHGVLKALISGITAGHLIASVLGNKAPPEATRTAYHDWLAGWFSADANKLREFYRGLRAAALA
jgi:flavin-dependent dehydrogenase